MTKLDQDNQDPDGLGGRQANRGEIDESVLLQRERAETRVRLNHPPQPEDLNTEQHLIHELRVHQVELEMQNEELREAQLALAVTRDRYFDLYDLAPVGYCTINEFGLIKEANLTAASLFGMTRCVLIKQPISRRILKEDQDIYYLHHKQLMTNGESQSFDLRMLNEEGTSLWTHFTMSLGRDHDGVSELRAVISDISQRKEAEIRSALLQKDLEEKNKELDCTRMVADKANQAKSDFLSSMSHELRTPLHAILGFSQLLASGTPPLTTLQSQSIDQISKAGWHLLELINEILDLAVIDSGKIILSIEAVSVSELIVDCETMVLPLAQQHGISIILPTENNEYFAQADPIRIKQILINLLSNAIKYNVANGEVTVICTNVASGRLRITVNDTGEGLTPDKISQLFQPFNRLGQEARNEGGTGIGLVVCKRLVELMGGAIGVESVPGKGSAFWIELDLATPPGSMKTIENSAQPEADIAKFNDSETGGKSRTLLYVEDNLANLKLVEAIVARRPTIVLVSAPNAMSGIKMASELVPDIILMDIDLPDISGIEALNILSRTPATSHIPVIALSANAMPRDIEAGIKAGFTRYLTKPIKVDEFMKTIDTYLNA